MLRALDVDAVALREKERANIDDVALLRELKESGYVFITADKSQKSREYEARALIQSGVSALFLGAFWSKKTFWDQAVWLISKWKRIEAFAGSVEVGTCADVKENGRARPFYL